MTTTSMHLELSRPHPQGELFLLQQNDDHFDALVYNTIGLNLCPAEVFNGIDLVALAEATGSQLVWRNPRRYWMMDELTFILVGEPRELGGLQFNFVARMAMPPGFNPAHSQADQAYHPAQIKRVSTYVFRAGRPVYLLRSPEQVTWVMQSYTESIDSTLTEEHLVDLGSRLALPDGWEFKSVVIDRDLVIDTPGLANIVPDDLANMYQGCIDGVNNFDPWS
jgi:hypothetical protein